jgi:hypothetical protein
MYEATYPRRAKGLVKQGRARFIDSRTLCLLTEACPPNKPLEDKKMDILSNREVNNLIETMKDTDPRSNGPRPVEETPANAPMQELLNRIDAVIQNAHYINESVLSIRTMAEGEWDNEEIVQKFVNGIVDVVRSREATNQKVIELIKEMYNSNKPEKSSHKSNVSDLIGFGGGIDVNDIISDLPPQEKYDFVRELLGMKESIKI